MANTVLLNKSLAAAQDAIQDYFDLFYELNSIELNGKNVTGSLELSDTPGTNTKTIRIVYANTDNATAQIEAYIALGYFLTKTQQVGKMTFAVLTFNGTVLTYKALISQDGITEPMVDSTIKNSINIIPLYSYVAAGTYKIKFNGFDFSLYKFILKPPYKPISGSFASQNILGISDVGDAADGEFEITSNVITYGVGVVSTDSIINNELIEIEVYERI